MPPFRLFMLVALAAAMSPSIAAADDDCTLEKSELRSHLDLRSPKIAKVVSTHRPDARKPDDRKFEQTVRLTTGTTVTFSVYGCEHFGYSFVFRTLPGVTKSTPLRELARIAREQVAAVPMRKVNEVWLGDTGERLTEEALAEATKMVEGSYSVPVGDATYELTVSEPGVLKIAYDFAL